MEHEHFTENQVIHLEMLTRHLTYKMKLGIIDDEERKCVFCKQTEETTFHLFECEFASPVWRLHPMPCQGVLSNPSSMNISFLDMYNKWLEGDLNSISMALAATKCWFIWKQRCLRVFENKNRTPTQLSQDISRHYNYWHPIAMLPTLIQKTTISQSQLFWTFPATNFYKLNCDASWLSAKTNAGFGFVLRNWTGTFKSAGVGSCRTDSAEEAEDVALLQTTTWAITNNLHNLAIEGDNKNTINYLQGKPNSIKWKCEALLDEVKKLAAKLTCFVGFHFVDRKANKAADMLAKKGRNSSQQFTFFAESPLFLIPTIVFDTVKAFACCNMNSSYVSLSEEANHTDSVIGWTTQTKLVHNESESAN
ncbi:uncharacterized protein LOC113280429 [Papaver somniferum]|uniref:uncharacterized protein LOC113280429 n=1 Tax=Papaver somniferum TaxID=3469 RepID=UPI000E703937|nr:uncharacterized protein LOC113280429 [Papaver somniferum]